MIDYTLFSSDKSVMRTTSDKILNTFQSMKESQVPFGVVVKPFGESADVSKDFSFSN
jgi:hypothetical protein